jgi:hypothetical protein
METGQADGYVYRPEADSLTFPQKPQTIPEIHNGNLKPCRKKKDAEARLYQ